MKADCLPTRCKVRKPKTREVHVVHYADERRIKDAGLIGRAMADGSEYVNIHYAYTDRKRLFIQVGMESFPITLDHDGIPVLTDEIRDALRATLNNEEEK